MVKTGEDDSFSSYKIINNIFDDYDILFIKDVKLFLWYLTIVDDVYNLICNIIETNNYKYVYGLTSSSGSMCLLNVLHKISIFKKGVIINGQTSLHNNILNKYKKRRCDCAIFDKTRILEEINESLLTPFNTIPKDMYDKYIFYYCNSVSDLVYYNYIKTIYPPNLHSNIFFDNTNNSHGGYIAHLLNCDTFLKEVKITFDKSAL